MMRIKRYSTSKRIMAVLLCAFLILGSINLGFASYLYAMPTNIQSSFKETLADDKLSADIELSIKEADNQTIESVTLPDKSKVEKEDFKYDEQKQLCFNFKAMENKELDYIVAYTEKEDEEQTTSEQPEEETIPEVKKETLTYEIKDIVSLHEDKTTSEVPAKKQVEKNDTNRSNTSIKASSGEDYTEGTASVIKTTLIEDTVDKNGTIESGKTLGYRVGVQLQPNAGSTTPASSVWIAYRFVIPEKTTSGGIWSFENSSYSWLMDMNDGTMQAKPKVENGNIILEGKVLHKSTGGSNVLNDILEKSLIVKNIGGVNGEKDEVSMESWLVSDGEVKKVTTSTYITVVSTPEFDLIAERPYDGVLSGYYNETTGDFSLTKPANPTDYKYGRFFINFSMVKSTGNEKLDPTKSVTWNVKSNVTIVEKNSSGQVISTREETDTRYQPIIIGVTTNSDGNDSKQLVNQLPNKKVADLTFDKKIDPWKYTSNGYYAGADYSYHATRTDMSVNAILSPTDKNSGYTIAAVSTLFFVPINETDDTLTERNFNVEISDLSLTSYTGTSITDSNATNNKITIDVPRFNDGSSAGGLFSREIGFRLQDTPMTQQAIGTSSYIGGRITNSQGSAIVDFGINAVNVLVKFEDGLDIDPYTLGPSGYTGTQKTLYAVKKDGTKWNDEVELNTTRDSDLVYYDSLQEAKANGEIVGILYEYRGGIWAKDELGYRHPYTLRSGSKDSIVVVQDVKIWRGNNIINETDTYTGTNGGALPSIPASTDLMVPNDNPFNTSNPRIYQRDTWDDVNGAAIQKEGHVWGDTLFIVKATVRLVDGSNIDNPTNAQAINGANNKTERGFNNSLWTMTTFDPPLGQRVLDRRFTFEVKGSEGREIYLNLVLNRGSTILKQFGEVRVSTSDNPVTYTKNPIGNGRAGTMEGGELIDPTNFKVKGDGFFTIYYSSEIGDMNNIANDAKIGSYWDGTNIFIQNRSKKDTVVTQDTVAFGTTIVKTNVIGAQKTVLNVGAKDEVGYRLTLDSSNDVMHNNYVLDVLPFNNDGRGSSFSGSYTLKDDKVIVEKTAVSGTSRTNEKVYYAQDLNVRTNGSSGSYMRSDSFKGKIAANLPVTFIQDGIAFTLATKNADGSWSVPTGVTPTALLITADMEPNERLAVNMQLKLTGQKKGDTYNNTASSLIEGYDPSDSIITETTIVSRNVTGNMWLDNKNNINHLYDAGTDELLKDITVKLYKADGTEITTDDNGEAYGTIKTDSKGNYEFKNVPYYVDGYYVTFTGANFTSYYASDKYVTGADNPMTSKVDSDTDGMYTDAILTATKSDVFTMRDDHKLVEDHTVKEVITVDSGVKEIASSFIFDLEKNNIKISKNTTLDTIKALINASAIVEVDGVKTDISNNINWDEVIAFDTSIYENTITCDLKVKDPTSGTIMKQKVTITVAKEVIITAPEVNIVVRDDFNPLADVTITDGEGNIVAVTNAMVTANTVPMEDGKATKLGNYQVNYSYTDAYGHTGVFTRTIKVHGPIEFLNASRIDILQGNSENFDRLEAYYKNSDNQIINITNGTYDFSIDKNVIQKNERTFTVTHPINHKDASMKQLVYVHGKIILNVPEDYQVMINTSVDPLKGVSASFILVEVDGTKTEVPVTPTTSADNPTTSVIAAKIPIQIDASSQIVPGLSNTTWKTYNVTFMELPIITTVTDRIEAKVGVSLADIKSMLEAKAEVFYAGGTSATNITADINWSEVSAIDTTIPDKTYKVKLHVTDKNGNKAEKEIEIYITKDIAMTLPTVNKVVKDQYDSTQDVIIYDGKGQLVDMKDVQIDSSKVDMSKPGNYDVTYTYTDAYGNTKTKTNVVHVHGAMKFENVKRVDLIEANILYSTNKVKSYYMNSDGDKIYVGISSNRNVDQSIVGKNEVEYTVKHPINNAVSTAKQDIYVHGDIVFKKPNMTIQKVNTTFDLATQVSASYQHVNDDGSITVKQVPVTSNKVTATKVGYLSGPVNSSVKIVEGLSNFKAITITVGFNGLPYIEAANTIFYTGAIPSKADLIKKMGVVAGMKQANGMDIVLTNKIDYSDVDRIVLDKNGNYQITLKVTDPDGFTTYTKVNVIIKIKKPSTPPVVPSKPTTPVRPARPTIPNKPAEPVKPSTPKVPEEKDIAAAVSRDIPLSETLNGISDDLVKSYISASTVQRGIVNFEILSQNVVSEVGEYEAVIRVDDGSVLTVKLRVVDDGSRDVDQPAYGRDDDCFIHWIMLLLFAGYSAYSIIAILKRRKDNKELEEALAKGDGKNEK